MNAADLSFGELAAALRRWAHGSLLDMAAVQLLIAHRHWLSRGPFLAAVDVSQATETIASVNWDALSDDVADAGLPGSRSELAVLEVACSIAFGWPVALGDALLSLDQTNVRLVANAVLTAGGAV